MNAKRNKEIKSRTYTYRFELTETLLIREEFFHLGSPRVMHPHGPVHELHPIGFTSLDDGIELDGVESHRLLQQHMLLLLGGEHGPPDVKARRQGDIHGVHVWVVEYCLVGPVGLRIGREVVFGSESSGLLVGPTAYGGEFGVGSECDCTRHLASYLGAAYDSESDSSVGHSGSFVYFFFLGETMVGGLDFRSGECGESTVRMTDNISY